MPYIKQDERERFTLGLKEIVATISNEITPGQLNYIIYIICLNYVKRKGYNYTSLNDVIGTLGNIKFELQRQIVAPYENEKLKENGDITV